MILMESAIKEPDDFFRQYRIEFRQTQQADGANLFKLKKCDEEKEALQQIDASSQTPIPLDKIGISPLQNSNISFSRKTINFQKNGQRNVPSDINPIKQLGPYSNQLGSDQLNEQNERGSHMQMQSRSNYQLELDYSSINPESQNANNLSDLKNPPIQSIQRVAAEKHVSLKLDGVFEKDDLEKLYDYSSSSSSSPSEEQFSESQQSSVKILNLTMKERLKKSFLRHLTFTKIESMSIQHTVKLLESQYRLINDLAADVSFAKLQNSSYGFSIFLQKITSIFPSLPAIPVLPPSSRICIILDLAAILFYSVCFIFLSLQLFLNAGIFKDNLIKRSNWIMPLALVFFAFDLVKGLITPFYHKGIYQNNISKIAARYVKYFCIFDLIPFIPLIGQFDQLSNYPLRVLLSLLYFSKLVSILICLNRINLSWGITDRNSLFRVFLKLFSYFFLLVHFLAILYHGISLIEIESGYDSDITWLKRYDLIPTNENIGDNNVWERYLRSLYSTASCLSASTTYQPQTKLEQIFNLFITFVSLIVFAFFLNEVHYSLKASRKNESNIQEEKKKLNNYMDQKNVPALLQGKVSNYFDYFQKQTSRFTSLDMANGLMEKLHGELREELKYATKNYYVPYFSSFLSSFSKETVNNTFSIIEELQFQPGDVIFHEGQYSKSAIYVIVSGQIEIYHTRYPAQSSQFYGSPKTRFTHLAYLKNHEIFGDISFITNLPHSASARCTELSTVVKIDRQKFINLIKENNQEEDFEMLCMLRDDVIFKKNYRAIHDRCWSCNRYGHLAKSCKLIHFYPLKSHIINTRTSNYKQQRQEYTDRKKRIAQIPLESLETNHKKFVEDFNDEIIDYVEKHFPGQSNLSDYLPSSHSATTVNQQSSNTEILTTDKINEHDKIPHAHINSGSGLELPLPFTAPNHKSSTNTLNESSMMRQAAGSSKARHKDSLDSDMGIKGRKDSAQTKNSNDSGIKPKNTNRSLNTKKESPLEMVMKVSDQATDTYNIRKSSDASQQLTETIQRDKTLKSQLTRGTQKTNKSNKSSSSIYRNKFDHSVVIPQRIDSRASSISTSPHKHSPTQQQDNAKILVSSTSKQSIQNNTPSVGGSGGAGLLGSSYDETESEQNQSYELVLPKIELVVNNNIIPKPHQLEPSPEHEHRSNISSVNLDQHSLGSKSETNLIAGISSPYVESYYRPYSMNSSLLEFDCMKNFKVYNTQNNLKIVLESTSPTKTRHLKRAHKKVIIIES